MVVTGPHRGTVVFDNSGTLSRVVMASTDLVEDGHVDGSVPDVDPVSPVALVSLGGAEYSAYDTTDPFGAVVERLHPPLHVALWNTPVRTPAVRAALEAERSVAASVVTDQLAAITDRLAADHPEWPELPLGIQVVVDIDGKRVERVIAYTTEPLPEGARTVKAVQEAGFVPHIVSGDAAHILEAVATAVDLPLDNVHPYQSAADKAATIEQLKATDSEPLIMVGDYVNDVDAFAAADYAIYVRDSDRTFDALLATADAVIEDVTAVPETIESLLTTQ